jgi:hypothetical protein
MWSASLVVPRLRWDRRLAHRLSLWFARYAARP